MSMRAVLSSIGLFFGLARLCPAVEPPKCPATSQISMSSGDFSSQPGVSFHLRGFAGKSVPEGARAPMCFQKDTVVQHGVIFVSSESLTHLFAKKISDAGGLIQDLKIEHAENLVRMTGTIKKVVPIHFTVEGPVSTDGTSISVNATSIKADGIPVKGLLALFGKSLGSVMGSQNVTGLTIEEDRASFRPDLLAHLKGHILSAVTSPNGLTLTYGPPSRDPAKSAQTARLAHKPLVAHR